MIVKSHFRAGRAVRAHLRVIGPTIDLNAAIKPSYKIGKSVSDEYKKQRGKFFFRPSKKKALRRAISKTSKNVPNILGMED